MMLKGKTTETTISYVPAVAAATVDIIYRSNIFWWPQLRVEASRLLWTCEKAKAAMASQSSGKMRQVVFAEFGSEGLPAVNLDRYLIKLEKLWNTRG